MVAQGASILDIGGESSRPGAAEVSVTEEIDRVLPVIEGLAGQTKALLSVDTVKPEVAYACLKAGAHIINDISGLKTSGSEMAAVVREFGAGLVLMHRRGSSQTMQDCVDYADVTRDVILELEESVDLALQAGIDREALVIDPGIGFAKTFEQNWQLMRELECFHDFGLPVLLGASRKSFLGTLIDKDPGDREFATATISAIALSKKIQILRVHNVSATRDVVSVMEKMGEVEDVRTF